MESKQLRVNMNFFAHARNGEIRQRPGRIRRVYQNVASHRIMAAVPPSTPVPYLPARPQADQPFPHPYRNPAIFTNPALAGHHPSKIIHAPGNLFSFNILRGPCLSKRPAPIPRYPPLVLYLQARTGVVPRSPLPCARPSFDGDDQGETEANGGLVFQFAHTPESPLNFSPPRAYCVYEG